MKDVYIRRMYFFILSKEAIDPQKVTIASRLQKSPGKIKQILSVKNDLTVNFVLEQWTWDEKIRNQTVCVAVGGGNIVGSERNEKEVLAKEKVVEINEKDGS